MVIEKYVMYIMLRECQAEYRAERVGGHVTGEVGRGYITSHCYRLNYAPPKLTGEALTSCIANYYCI